MFFVGWPVDNIAQAASSSSIVALKKKTVSFTSEDFSDLSTNEHQRYASSSKNIAHAVLTQDGTALQYGLPSAANVDTPIVCQITNIEKIERGEEIHYRAMGPSGRIFYSKRSDRALVKFDDVPVPVDIAYFSEAEDEDETNSSTGYEKLHERQGSSAAQSKKITKGGYPMLVEPESVRVRDLDRARGLSQNIIMGESARDAYEAFFKQMEAKLSPEMIRILNRAFKANIKVTPENQYRPEWLHAYGFSLTPVSQNPQHKGNLGAAAKWANTEMMVLERIAKWFALNQNADTQITVNTLFQMLHQSELIETIHFEVNIEFQTRFIRFIQDLDVFKEYPVFRKASDLAQATGISHAILSAQMPVCSEKIGRVSVLAETKSASASSSNSSVYKRVPESFTARTSNSATQYIATIIDLETTGLDASTDKIIEIGMLSFSFTCEEGILEFIDSYNGLNDPGQSISAEITAITKITNEQLRGLAIDWESVSKLLEKSDYILCHNSNFDRKFLERQTPLTIQTLICSMPFGCTMQDINWSVKGYRTRKLKDLNLQLGFEFDGHRAINDCWATLNLLREVDGSLAELMGNVAKNKTLLCATGATYAYRDLLKLKNFQWSDGLKGTIPKCWFIYAGDDELSEIKKWLDDTIYRINGKSNQIPQRGNITAVDRYSVRAELLSSSSTATQNSRFFNKRSSNGDDVTDASNAKQVCTNASNSTHA